MKTRPFISILLILLFPFFLFTQTPSMDAWKDLLHQRDVAEYFSGIFDNLGVIVDDTGEQFTAHHKGDHFTLSEGVNPNECDYVIHMQTSNIQKMKNHGLDRKISVDESYQIMQFLFTPLTKSSLTNPWLQRPLYRWLAGVENHTIVYLENPTNDEFVVHTLIYLNKKWIVIPGVHGNAKRIMRLSPDDGIAYQRKVFEAQKQNNAKAWRKFKKWYLDWRKGVTVES